MHVGLLKVDNAQRRSQDATLKMFQNETIMSTGNVVSLSSEWPIEQSECLNCSTWGVFLVVLFEFSEKSVDLDLFRPL
jgi:hypothetical protein